MKVCVRHTCKVMSSGSGERVTLVVMSIYSRNVMASSSIVADADADAEDKGTSLSRIKTVRKRFVITIT